MQKAFFKLFRFDFDRCFCTIYEKGPLAGSCVVEQMLTLSLQGGGGGDGSLWAVANYRHFVSNERCSFELKPPPPPPNEHTHNMHMKKMLTKKCGHCLHDAVHMVVSSSPKYFREGLWCPCLYRRAFSCFLSFLSGVGVYLPPFVLHITDSASDGARSWRSRVSSAEDFDKLGLGHEGVHLSEVCNIMDFFVTETTSKPCKTTRSSPKMPVFLPNEQAWTLPPLKRTSFVWNKVPLIGNGPLHKTFSRVYIVSQWGLSSYNFSFLHIFLFA